MLEFSLGSTYDMPGTIPNFGKHNVIENGKEEELSHFVTNFAYGIILGTMRALFKRGENILSVYVLYIIQVVKKFYFKIYLQYFRECLVFL